MKKIYNRPEVMIQEFEAQEFCSTCSKILVCNAGNSVTYDLWKYPGLTTDEFTTPNSEMFVFISCNQAIELPNNAELIDGFISVFDNNVNSEISSMGNVKIWVDDATTGKYNKNYTLRELNFSGNYLDQNINHHIHATTSATKS